MKTTKPTGLAALTIALLLFLLVPGAHTEPDDTPEAPEKTAAAANRPATVEEARGRARLLHEAFHGTLQIMHRDFFDPDDRHRIPSASLEDVFDELARAWGVTLTWLGVNAETLDVDHEPQDDFEKKAVAALASGKEEFEAVEGDLYRRVGVIVLHNRCLKCHVPDRTSLEDRVAGLAITMPFGKK